MKVALQHVKEMDLANYTVVVMIVAFVPMSIVFVIGAIITFGCTKKSENLMSIVMKGLISKRIIDGKPTYLFCNRQIQCNIVDGKPTYLFYNRQIQFNIVKYILLFLPVTMFSICVQAFFLFAVVEVTYYCDPSPDIDCFKKKDDVKLTETFAYDESPIICSTISRDDFVICLS